MKKWNFGKLATAAGLAAIIAGIAVNGSPIIIASAGTTEDGVKIAVDAVTQVATVICAVLGAFFLLGGAIKMAQGMVQDNGPGQHQAYTMIASGLALMVVGFGVIPNIAWADLIMSAVATP